MWDHAQDHDIADFKFWRMTDERNPRRVVGATWHGELAALASFYGWAARHYRVANPIVVREQRWPAHLQVPGQGMLETWRGGSAGAGAPVTSSRLAEPAGIRDRDIKWFDPGGYARWRDLGLRGIGLDGREARVWRGRNIERDAAFADLLYGTGLRLQEGGSLLILELPSLARERDYLTCRLAAACAKGRRGRHYWMPFAVRDALDQYTGPGGERARAVERAQAAGRYGQANAWVIVEELRGRRLRLRRRGEPSQDVPLDALRPDERARLFRETARGLEPLALWLNEDGLPRRHHGWENTFRTANQRIKRLGLEHFEGTPHMLRHSFALKWYSVGRLIYEQRLGYLNDEETRDFRAQFGNTWDLLRVLLGHRSLETTMNIYLEPFQMLEVEFLLEAARGANLAGVLHAVFQEHPLVRADPLAPIDSPDKMAPR